MIKIFNISSGYVIERSWQALWIIPEIILGVSTFFISILLDANELSKFASFNGGLALLSTTLVIGVSTGLTKDRINGGLYKINWQWLLIRIFFIPGVTVSLLYLYFQSATICIILYISAVFSVFSDLLIYSRERVFSYILMTTLPMAFLLISVVLSGHLNLSYYLIGQIVAISSLIYLLYQWRHIFIIARSKPLLDSHITFSLRSSLSSLIPLNLEKILYNKNYTPSGWGDVVNATQLLSPLQGLQAISSRLISTYFISSKKISRKIFYKSLYLYIFFSIIFICVLQSLKDINKIFILPYMLVYVGNFIFNVLNTSYYMLAEDKFKRHSIYYSLSYSFVVAFFIIGSFALEISIWFFAFALFILQSIRILHILIISQDTKFNNE